VEARTFIISGRVTDQDGKPVAGANLYVPFNKTARPKSDEEVGYRVVGTADEGGHFKVTIKDAAWNWVIAYLPGFGVELGSFNFRGGAYAEQTLPSPLRLRPDVPITGRIVNTEGKPLAGVSMSTLFLCTPDPSLDDFLATWKDNMKEQLRGPSPDRRRDLMPNPEHIPLERITGPMVTDRDGRFTVRGAGADRLLYLRISGTGLARSTVCVVARPGFDPKPYNDELQKKDYERLRQLGFRGLNPPDFTAVAEAGKEVSGVVTDRTTGEPIRGCRLYAPGAFNDGGGVRAQTDAKGRYLLSGLRKGDGDTSISIDAPGTTYLAVHVRAGAAAGPAPVRLDIRLRKGAVVTGQVIDKRTGDPEPDGPFGSFRFVTLPNNTFFAADPESARNTDALTIGPSAQYLKFCWVTVPGPVLILYRDGIMRYRQAVPDPDHKELFKARDDGGWSVVTADGSLLPLDGHHAVKVLDVKENAENKVDLIVDSGVTAQLTVRDTDGKPLTGAWLAGITDGRPATSRLAKATTTVYALDPASPRVLSVYHPERHLGVLVTVRGDEKEPVVAKLGPLGRLTGRLLGPDGKPLVGATVKLLAARSLDNDLYEAANEGKGPVCTETDKDGRFTRTDLLPAMTFEFACSKGGAYYVGKPRVGLLKVKPGETLDLGDRVLEPSR
jgi:hypothetical protein